MTPANRRNSLSAERVPLVQVLRAVAALSVAFGHVLHDARDLSPAPPGWLASLSAAMPWPAGVDIFFVISGFVIVHASQRLFGGGFLASRIFLARRVARIVPLYWGATAFFLATELAAPAAVHGANDSVPEVVASFLFIPWARPDGVVQPVFGLGWTLNFEMFFYAVFACWVGLRKPVAVFSVSAVLLALVAVGLLVPFASVQLATWSSPIVLEFCAGMFLAAVLRGRIFLSVPVRAGLALVALGLLRFADTENPLRVIEAGGPALLLVAACVLGRPRVRLPRIEAAFVLLGDASYALYLTHPFPMRALALLWHRVHPAHAELLYVGMAMTLILATGILVHLVVERRVVAQIRRRLEPQLVGGG